MASNYHAKGLKRSALTVALGLCFVGGVQAQTNTGGAVAGHATAGDTITISNSATGYSRTVTVGSDGNYRFSQVPSGQYQLSRNGGSPRAVNVNVGVSANVDFGGDATTLDTVTVVGSGAVNPIDVSSVESTTILTAEQINKIPVPRNATAVALLAPGTVRGAGNVGELSNLPSFGGSSVAENQYYVNGLNITNTFKNLAFAQIPFEAIAEQQVKTGGYGAEFGRSTGGVLNMITKRGTNEFKAGGSIYWEPEALVETNPDFYWNNGRLISDNSKDKGWEATAAVWAGGALVKDRLFAYGLIQYGKRNVDNYPGTSNGVSGGNNLNTATKRPQWLLKMDWQIADDHSLELTAFSDKSKAEAAAYATTFGTVASPSTEPNRGAYAGTTFREEGGTSWSLKYTGYLTDNLTLSALYGRAEFNRKEHGVTSTGASILYDGSLTNAVAGCPLITDSRPGTGPAKPQRVSCSISPDGFIGRADSGDEREQFRLDAEWQLGDHLLRFGYDADKFDSRDGKAYSGGASWVYQTVGAGTANEYERVRYRNFRTSSDPGVRSKAFYIEDSWSITDNFMAYVGLRWDNFENVNSTGEKFVEIKNQFAPRLGFSWDVFGDSSFKVFGNAGRYALPVTANVAVRSASASLYEEIFYTYTGIDPVTKAPTGLTRIPNPAYVGTPLEGSTQTRYLNGEDGNPKYAAGYASKNLEPMYQDEFILGFQKQLTDQMSLGVRALSRTLKTSIDDNCDYHTVLEVAAEQGYDTSNGPGAQFNHCFMVNPGKDVVFQGDVDGDGKVETIEIPAARLGPGSQRKYKALEFFFQGNWDKLFLQGSYTWSKSIGNVEGSVKSDNAGQTDTNVSADFDYTTVMLGAYGYLPNDRRHSLKLFGNYEFTDEWSVGANLMVQSGRPESCYGVYRGLNTSFYGNIHFSCDTGAPTSGGNNGETIVPRGTVGRTPWTTSFDLNVAYKPGWAEGLQFKVDVFNLLNNRKPIAVNEQGEDAAGNPAVVRERTYLTPLAWQAPRSVRFMVQYDF